MVGQWSLPNYFTSKTQKISLRYWRHAIKNSYRQMQQIWRRMEMIHLTIGRRRDERGTHKHTHGFWILWSVSNVRSKTMHSLFRITLWLPYITLCYIDSRFFLPLEQSRTVLLGCRLAASNLREAARWQLFYFILFLLWTITKKTWLEAAFSLSNSHFLYTVFI